MKPEEGVRERPQGLASAKVAGVRPQRFQENEEGRGAKAAGEANEEGRKQIMNSLVCPAEAKKCNLS